MKKTWPNPSSLGMETAYNIDSEIRFNEVVGNPHNWKRILEDRALYESWILPKAILLFSKPWFDRKKWKNKIQNSLPFPMFTNEQKEEARKLGVSIDETFAGRAAIAKIIEITSKSLRKYLEAKWYNGKDIKPPGAYIIDSIKNGMLRDLGDELGFKMKFVWACPYCLKNNYKVALTFEGLGYYSCPRCKDRLINLKTYLKNLEDGEETENIKKEIKEVEFYTYFNSNDLELPGINIWHKPDELILNNENVQQPLIANTINIDQEILAKQRVGILLEEIIIKMSKLNINTFSGFISWSFYLAVANWMTNHWHDASSYFFYWTKYKRNNKNITHIIRGQDGGIHQCIFGIWMDILDSYIRRINKMRPKIKEIGDFSWFCRPPKFSGGPNSIFRAQVDSKMSIQNNTQIIQFYGNIKPRMARILSIFRYNKDYIGDVRLLRWHSIHLSHKSKLNPGDEVEVEAIMMSGHCTHAPIQRILRLRSQILKDIINIIISEDESENINSLFWKRRKKVLENAKRIVKEQEYVSKR